MKPTAFGGWQHEPRPFPPAFVGADRPVHRRLLGRCVGGAVVIAYETPVCAHGPHSYAKKLARYLNDPQAIYIACRRQFGREGVPTPGAILSMIEQRKSKMRPAVEVAENDDGRDWSYNAERERRRNPNGIVLEAPPTVPTETAEVAAEPLPLLSVFPGDLVRKVALSFRLPYREIVGARRFRSLVTARTVAATLLHDRGLSYPQIGRVLGGRDHSTVINLVQKFPAYAKAYPDAMRIYETLRAEDAA